MSQKACVITGSRAEYGLLTGLIELFAQDENFDLQLVVTGSHVEEQYGYTLKVIEDDGFVPAAVFSIEMNDDSAAGVLRSLSRALEGFSRSFTDLTPDLVVLLGDRYEALAAAVAATICRVPIVHIHGGEVTAGAFDESFRHSISKMSHLHFTAAEEYRSRVIQLGEHPNTVFNVGAIGVDSIWKLDLLNQEDFVDELKFLESGDYFVVTYHPVTLERANQDSTLVALLSALDRFPDHKILITGVNADPGNQRLSDALNSFAGLRADRVAITKSLGQLKYLSAVKHAAAVVGNSSSGILEAPALGVPTVNIGDRQKGRVRAGSVIDCGESQDEILEALRRATSFEFRSVNLNQPYPFGEAGVSSRIMDVIRQQDFSGMLKKQFYDLPKMA